MANSPFRYAGFRYLIAARVLSSGGNWMKTVARQPDQQPPPVDPI